MRHVYVFGVAHGCQRNTTDVVDLFERIRPQQVVLDMDKVDYLGRVEAILDAEGVEVEGDGRVPNFRRQLRKIREVNRSGSRLGKLFGLYPRFQMNRMLRGYSFSAAWLQELFRWHSFAMSQGADIDKSEFSGRPNRGDGDMDRALSVGRAMIQLKLKCGASPESARQTLVVAGPLRGQVLSDAWSKFSFSKWLPPNTDKDFSPELAKYVRQHKSSTDKITQDTINKFMNDRHAISEFVSVARIEMPEVVNACIDSVDLVLAQNVLQCDGPVIVAVVGLGHVDGLSRMLTTCRDKVEGLSSMPALCFGADIEQASWDQFLDSNP